MKRILFTVFMVFCSLCATAKWYSGDAQFLPFRLEQLGDSVYISFNCNVSDIHVKANRTVILTPSLVTISDKMKFPSILIKGRTEYLITKRLAALGESRKSDTINSYVTVKGFGRKRTDVVSYVWVTPYVDWMKDSRLFITESVEGCGGRRHTTGSYEVVDRIKLEPPIVPYVIVPHLSYVKPEIEVIKRREMMAEAYLDFKVSSTDIDPEFGNNPMELKKITSMFTSIASDPDATVRSISVVGYASPEGGYGINQRLSEGRANALVYYLLPRFNFRQSLYHVEFGGENWAGLEAKMKESQMDWKYDVLDILEDLPQKVSSSYSVKLKEKLIKVEWGLAYQYIVKNICPSLRKANCKIEYDIKSFDIDKAKQIIKIRPQNLSLNEMYHVATTYPVGSDEFVNVFDVAVRMFPQDQTANLNAAIAQLSLGQTEQAETYLLRVTDHSPQYNNAMGVLCMLNGAYDNAEKFLIKAQEANLAEATQNLEELRKKRDNIDLIESKKRNK